MTPKEKAEELVDNFKMKVLDRDGTSAMNYFEIKQCALIAVDEILNISKIVSIRRDKVYMELEYWIEVKQEIENL
jgi:hypothetical protein